MSYALYIDPRGSLLRVLRAELVALGIAERISLDSHQRGNFVYLAAGEDQAIFLRARFARYITETTSEKVSPIRGYSPFKG